MLELLFANDRDVRLLQHRRAPLLQACGEMNRIGDVFADVQDRARRFVIGDQREDGVGDGAAGRRGRIERDVADDLHPLLELLHARHARPPDRPVRTGRQRDGDRHETPLVFGRRRERGVRKGEKRKEWRSHHVS